MQKQIGGFFLGGNRKRKNEENCWSIDNLSWPTIRSGLSRSILTPINSSETLVIELGSICTHCFYRFCCDVLKWDDIVRLEHQIKWSIFALVLWSMHKIKGVGTQHFLFQFSKPSVMVSEKWCSWRVFKLNALKCSLFMQFTPYLLFSFVHILCVLFSFWNKKKTCYSAFIFGFDHVMCVILVWCSCHCSYINHLSMWLCAKKQSARVLSSCSIETHSKMVHFDSLSLFLSLSLCFCLCLSHLLTYDIDVQYDLAYIVWCIFKAHFV